MTQNPRRRWYCLHNKDQGQNNKEKKKWKPMKGFFGFMLYCDNKGHATKECRKRTLDEKNDTLKLSWRGKKMLNNVEISLELFTATEEVCS